MRVKHGGYVSCMNQESPTLSYTTICNKNILCLDHVNTNCSIYISLLTKESQTQLQRDLSRCSGEEELFP